VDIFFETEVEQMATSDRNKEEQRGGGEVSRSPRQGTQVAQRRGFEPLFLSPGEFFNNPFSAMRRMHEEMDRIFGEALGNRSGASGFGGGLSSWSPAVEVSERDNQMIVCAELPGLKPEDVKVEVTDDALVIQGERKYEHEDKTGGRYHSERQYGHFYRAIPLPEGASAEQAKADFKNGELQVTVPVHRPENKRRQIPIGGSSTQGGSTTQSEQKK
jgi:HSP20 family protein